MSAPDPTAPSTTPPRRVTAAMVAQHAGVSTATVSLVANGKSAGRVSERNVIRVREAIADLGYVVDGIGSSLARGVSSTIIMVAPDISNPFFARLIAGVRQVLGSEYQLLLAVTDPGQAPGIAETRRLLGLRPAGLLIDAPNPRFIGELGAPVPVVAVDAPDAPGNVPAVNLDVAQGARDMAAHFARLGHRKVAYLDAINDTATMRQRRTAFAAAAAELGMQLPEGAVTSCTIELGQAARHFALHWPRWRELGITAVGCATDTHAYGVLQEARAAAVRVPEDLAVAGFDDLPYSATTNPPLTSINLDATELGRTAATQLRQLIEGHPLEQSHVTLAGRLIERGSTLRL
ncbi:LacI family transcriptional regulator [Glutamicibacter sp. MNS18]|uniref:LacI family DNA-binding transcriptional regulator n=1 Tax=Glutamicibacter sp. MNS18 TaxID=2989817 RepID=UPI002236125B|nr:LacI family DNA-binding transcriptional regulator [Glutamicibacter sp. MNS18]MCW4466665.1 LacI family transcriptional regulator [Glutamicibacter sp. MNS18]